MDKYVFYKAVLIVIDAVRRWAGRYATLAAEQVAACDDPVRKAELERMAAACTRVPYEPAKTFYEAVQAVWFSQVLLQIESNGHSLSFGRFDQYMDPYYEADLAAGRISEDEATELLANLWIKTSPCRRYAVRLTPTVPQVAPCIRTSPSVVRRPIPTRTP